MSDWLLPGAQKDVQSVTADWQPVTRTLIDGVRVHETSVVTKRNGAVTELFRGDWSGDAAGHVFVVRLTVAGLSAWHAHAHTLDRLTVIDGSATLVLYDGRTDSHTHGRVNEFHLCDRRPMTIIVPPQVWHGVRNAGDRTCVLINMPDRPYAYADPDHWRLPPDTRAIPYDFGTMRGGGV
jgi:dTDP-4-dehydrorhamnose 3,5-epimerase